MLSQQFAAKERGAHMENTYNPTNPPGPSSKTGFGAIDMNNKRTYWDSDIKFLKLEPRGWQRYRFLGPITKVEYHWLELPRKGSNNVVKRIPLICPDFDVKEQLKNFSNPQCPICRFGREELKAHERLKKILPNATYLTHVLVRANQENAINGAVLNPIKLSMSLARKLYELGELNQVNYQGQLMKADLADPYWGRDVFINYDENKAPADRYMVNLDQAPRPLTLEEFGYLEKLTDFRNKVVVSTPKEIEDVAISCGYLDRNGNLITTMLPPSGLQQSNPVHGISSELANHVSPPNSGVQFQNGYAPHASAQTPQNFQQPAAAPAVAPATASPVPPPPQSPTFLASVQAPAVFAPSQYTGEAPASFAGTADRTYPEQPPQSQPYSPPAMYVVNPSHTTQHTSQQGNAAVAHHPESLPGYAVPSFEKKFQIVGAPKPLTGAELEQFIKQYAEANAALCTPLQPATNGELLGFHVPKCFVKYRGDSVCIRCPIRKQCIA